MKKILATVMTMVMVIVMSATPVSASSSLSHLKYDVDGDGLVSTMDVLELQQVLSGKKRAINWERYDVNKDGIISTADFTAEKQGVIASPSYKHQNLMDFVLDEANATSLKDTLYIMTRTNRGDVFIAEFSENISGQTLERLGVSNPEITTNRLKCIVDSAGTSIHFERA